MTDELQDAANDPSTPATVGLVKRLAVPGTINSTLLIIPDSMKGKFVRFTFDDNPTGGNVAYVRFGLTAADSFVDEVGTSTVFAGPQPPAGTLAELGTEPDLDIAAGSFQDELIDPEWEFMSYKCAAATGILRICLKQGTTSEG